ncbi:hypothetical protein Q5692_01655 [Microcoleus sp. C2C3]
MEIDTSVGNAGSDRATLSLGKCNVNLLIYQFFPKSAYSFRGMF